MSCIEFRIHKAHLRAHRKYILGSQVRVDYLRSKVAVLHNAPYKCFFIDTNALISYLAGNVKIKDQIEKETSNPKTTPIRGGIPPHFAQPHYHYTHSFTS